MFLYFSTRTNARTTADFLHRRAAARNGEMKTRAEVWIVGSDKLSFVLPPRYAHIFSRFPFPSFSPSFPFSFIRRAMPFYVSTRKIVPGAIDITNRRLHEISPPPASNSIGAACLSDIYRLHMSRDNIYLSWFQIFVKCLLNFNHSLDLFFPYTYVCLVHVYAIWSNLATIRRITAQRRARDLVRRFHGCKWIRIKCPGECFELNHPSHAKHRRCTVQWTVRKLRRFSANDIWRTSNYIVIGVMDMSEQLICHASNRGSVFVPRKLRWNV